MKIFQNIALLSLLFLFQNCFEIIHFIQKTSDNSFKMIWTFSIATPLTKGDNKSENITDKMKSSETSAKDKLSELVDNLKTESFTNDMESGVKISFDVKDVKKFSKALDTEESFPIAPKIIPEKSQMIFKFKPDKKNKKAVPKKENKKSKDGKEEDPADSNEEQTAPSPADDPMMGQILGQIMSSASYKLLLQGFEVKKAYAIGKKSPKKINLDKMVFGETTMIKIPFMTLLTTETEGYDVVIQY